MLLVILLVTVIVAVRVLGRRRGAVSHSPAPGARDIRGAPYSTGQPTGR